MRHVRVAEPKDEVIRLYTPMQGAIASEKVRWGIWAVSAQFPTASREDARRNLVFIFTARDGDGKSRNGYSGANKEAAIAFLVLLGPALS